MRTIQIASAAAALILCATAAPAQLVRFGGAKLTRSVQNEADAAIDRACAWLIAEQAPDGSWGGDVKTTAACILALAGSGDELPEADGAAVERGIAWLTATNALNIAAQPALKALAEAAGAEAPLPDILKASDSQALSSCPDSQALSCVNAEKAFLFAYAINRDHGGELPSRDGAPTDWRAPLASKWTTSQEIDARGRGHWRSSPLETAFAILLLKEL